MKRSTKKFIFISWQQLPDFESSLTVTDKTREKRRQTKKGRQPRHPFIIREAGKTVLDFVANDTKMKNKIKDNGRNISLF